MKMKLIWTKHAIERGYRRIGKDYGMDVIVKKIVKNIHRATLNSKGGEAVIPFNLDGQWYLAVLIPRGSAGTSCVIKTMYPISDDKFRRIFKKSPNSKNF
jgi:hypothetical protein|tara:strand:- start:323 stop:622 length:300 start_codon:yes stop_codon:yes gene_type:complete